MEKTKTAQNRGPQAFFHKSGIRGNAWWAYADGVVLRDYNGNITRFVSKEFALAKAAEVCANIAKATANQ